MNISEREVDVSKGIILARIKRDLRIFEKLLDRDDYASIEKAWDTSGRISARIEILMDRAHERARQDQIKLDEAFWAGAKELNEAWLREKANEVEDTRVYPEKKG